MVRFTTLPSERAAEVLEKVTAHTLAYACMSGSARQESYFSNIAINFYDFQMHRTKCYFCTPPFIARGVLLVTLMSSSHCKPVRYVALAGCSGYPFAWQGLRRVPMTVFENAPKPRRRDMFSEGSATEFELWSYLLAVKCKMFHGCAVSLRRNLLTAIIGLADC